MKVEMVARVTEAGFIEVRHAGLVPGSGVRVTIEPLDEVGRVRVEPPTRDWMEHPEIREDWLQLGRAAGILRTSPLLKMMPLKNFPEDRVPCETPSVPLPSVVPRIDGEDEEP